MIALNGRKASIDQQIRRSSRFHGSTYVISQVHHVRNAKCGNICEYRFKRIEMRAGKNLSN